MASLYELDLSNNQLSGAVPAELSNLFDLNWLVQSCNELSGVLPQGSVQLPLGKFLFHDTNLCEPADDAFQAWLASIYELERTDVLCGSAD